MQPFASAIRENIDLLVDRYDTGLRGLPGYTRLPEAQRRDLARQVLNLIAQCLDTGDQTALVQYVQQRAAQWEASGFPLVWFQQALIIPEEILTPLIDSVEASSFLWKALNRSQNAVWQLMVDRAQQSQQALQASQTQYQTIFESTPIMFWLKDAHNRTLRINQAAAIFEGARPADVEGKSAFDLYPREQAEAFYQDDLAVIQSGQPKLGIIEQHTSVGTGKLMWVETGKVPVRNEQGEISGVLAFAVDITARREAEETLARERNLLRTLVDALPDQVFVKDTQGRLVLYNQADAQAMGLASTDEALGKTVYDFYPRDLADVYFADDMAVIESEQPLIDREEPGLNEDGSQRWILTTKVPLKDQAGRHQGLVGIARDITQRKQIQATLQESEERFRRFSEATTEGLVFHDKGVILDANPAIVALFGFTTAAELVGRNLLEFIVPDSRPLVLQKMQLDDVHPYEVQCARSDGSIFPAETSTRVYQYGERAIRASAVRDITARKQAEEALARSAEKQQLLSQRLRAAIEAAEELMRAPDLDTLYRRVVELAREKLGVERCGLFIADPAHQFMLGTYGTDDQGRTTDEHAAHEPIELHQAAMSLSREQMWIVQEAPQTHWKEGKQQSIGTGWVGGAAIRSASGPIGILYNDAAISQTPVDHDLQEALAVYCSMLGSIIESKRLEHELTTARRQFQNIIEFLPDATFVIDRDKRVIAWNRAIEEMSGMAKEDILGKGDYEYALPFFGVRRPIIIDLIGAPNPEIEAKYDFVQPQGDTLYSETFVPTMFGGRGAYVAVTASPLLDDAGNYAGAIESIRDITERKQLEMQVRESLARRSIQVQTSVEVAQHVAAAPEIGELFHRVVTLVKERFNFYHAQLFRYVPAEDAVELITGYGEIGQKMLAAGHKLAMGRGVVGTAAATGQSILAADVTRDLDWRPNPNLPDTKGELAVPIKLGGGDAESQAHALKHFINSKYDGIAVTAIDPEAVAHLTHESLRQGKPVVAITSDLGQANQTALVCAVEHELGYLLGVQAGTWAKQHVPDNKSVQVGLLTYRMLPNVIERERGLIDGIRSVIGERARIVASESALEAKEAAYLAEGWLRDYPDLNMIVAYNDAAALGAYQAVQNLGWHDPDQFFIGGIDAIPEALTAIQQGGVYQATVNQPPEVMGIMAVRTLIAAIKGIPVKPLHAIYCAPVNRSNVAEFSGTSRELKVMSNQDIIPVESLSGLDLSDLRLGLSVLTLANPFFAVLADSAQQEAQRLGVQLVVNDPSRILGVLDVQSDQANALTDDDRLLLEGLCGQIASAMESTRLLEELRRGETELSQALKIAKLAYWEYDVENDLFLFNDQFYALFHTTAEQVGGYQISSAQYAGTFVYPDDLPIVGVEIERALNSTDRHYSRQLEHRIRYADGGIGYISVSINIDRDEQGRILRYYGANQDITERKRTEAEREQLLADQQKRALQLHTASEVSRAASSILKLDELLPQAAELIQARFDLYYVGIFLLDETEHWALLSAGSGEAGQQMLANGHKLKIGGNSMISQCITMQQARIALDVGEEAVRFDNPLLPLTRSEIALPLVSRGRVIGAATIQSDQPAAFSTEDIAVLQSMADQLSNAVENARLYQQAQAALQEVDAINRRLTGEAWDTYLRQQAGREVFWLADDESAAPQVLSQLDEQLTAGEIVVEPDPDDGAEATVTAPILLRGQPIGALRLRTPLSEWDDDTEVMLADIAGHIAQAVENARLVEQTQRTAQRERLINEINSRVRQTVTIDSILDTAVKELGKSLAATHVFARLAEPASPAAARDKTE